MWEVFTQVATNVGMSFENVVTLVFMLMGFIFYARNVLVGLMTHIIITGGLFMWFYVQGLNYGVVLTLFFIFIVLLSFSIYAEARQAPQGGLT